MLARLLITLVALISLNNAEDLPPFLHVCAKNEPNMFQCFKTAGEKLKPQLVTGVPEYNIPSLEPLEINELIAEESDGLRLTTSNVKASGCTGFEITNGKIDMDKLRFELDIFFPVLRIQAQYKINGRILMMPIKGEGPIEANMTNCDSKTVLQGELYERDGDTYMRYTDMALKVNVGDGVVKIENLFNGDKILNDVVNDAVNKNLKLFNEELMPIVENALSATILDIANKIVKPFTFKQLFPH